MFPECEFIHLPHQYSLFLYEQRQWCKQVLVLFHFILIVLRTCWCVFQWQSFLFFLFNDIFFFFLTASLFFSFCHWFPVFVLAWRRNVIHLKGEVCSGPKTLTWPHTYSNILQQLPQVHMEITISLPLPSKSPSPCQNSDRKLKQKNKTKHQNTKKISK